MKSSMRRLLISRRELSLVSNGQSTSHPARPRRVSHCEYRVRVHCAKCQCSARKAEHSRLTLRPDDAQPSIDQITGQDQCLQGRVVSGRDCRMAMQLLTKMKASMLKTLEILESDRLTTRRRTQYLVRTPGKWHLACRCRAYRPRRTSVNGVYDQGIENGIRSAE